MTVDAPDNQLGEPGSNPGVRIKEKTK